VIEELELEPSCCSRHPAIFRCPHCGFAYRRRQPLPKSEQYAGQVNVVDRGWLWMETFRKLMDAGTPYYRVAETLHCYFNTVKQLAVEKGFLSEDKGPPERDYHYPRSSAKKPSQKPMEPSEYRQIWLQAVQDNPGASRSRLIQINPVAYQWLRANDWEWYEAHSPPSRINAISDWAAKDDEILRKVQNSVEHIRNIPGRPVWINLRSVEKYSGVQLYRNLAAGKLPKTQACLDEALETDDEWRKRKIQWAMHELHEADKPLHLPQIQIKACFDHAYFVPLESFAHECIDSLV